MRLKVYLSVVGVWDWWAIFSHVLRGGERGGGGRCGCGMSHCVARVAVAPTKVARRNDLRYGLDIEWLVEGLLPEYVTGNVCLLNVYWSFCLLLR